MRFKCRRPGAGTFIEFGGPEILAAELNGRAIPLDRFAVGRLPLNDLAPENTLTIRGFGAYSHDGMGISRFEDPIDNRVYLHSQFAEHSTYMGYACFDQPDLKATFDFTVRAFDDWQVVSTTPGNRADGGIWTFPTTPPLPTYITALVAGPYDHVHQDHRGIPLGLYCRQSLSRYLDADEFFEITRQGLDYFVQRFAYPFPFGKYDQLIVPEFAAGAMENAACVTFHERAIFRSRVTDAQRMLRAETILHELAHMWFGNLVTPRWWDDLWLNETFAEYMGFSASVAATRFKTAWVKFAIATEPAARAQDQLPTTHPIVADVPDTESATLNLDSITYNKGASVLKQLVAWVGEDAFFKGVETYFRTNAFGNAELSDFLAALEESSGRDLRSWSQRWLETAGVNTIGARLSVDDGRITSANVQQDAQADHPTLRPHRLRVGLFDLSGPALRRRRSIELDIDGATTEVPGLRGERAPDLVLVNDDDLAYTKVSLDPRSLAALENHLRDIEDPLARTIAWGALWDMVRDAALRPRDFITIALNNIGAESDPPVLTTLIARIEQAVASYCDPARRPAMRALLARAAKANLDGSVAGSDLQLVWASTFIGAARATDDIAWVTGLLDGTTQLSGMTVDFEVRWRVVNALATIGAVTDELIASELDRDPTDEGQRAAALARAARPLAAAKNTAWRTVIHDAKTSAAMKRAIAGGFHRTDQQELLGVFVEPYFDSLMPTWESFEAEQALLIIGWMYPHAVLTHGVVDATDRALELELPGPIRRSLLEARDAVKRALRAQALDRT